MHCRSPVGISGGAASCSVGISVGGSPLSDGFSLDVSVGLMGSCFDSEFVSVCLVSVDVLEQMLPLQSYVAGQSLFDWQPVERGGGSNRAGLHAPLSPIYSTAIRAISPCHTTDVMWCVWLRFMSLPLSLGLCFCFCLSLPLRLIPLFPAKRLTLFWFCEWIARRGSVVSYRDACLY